MSTAPSAPATALRSIRDLPGPRRLPVIGNAHQLLRISKLHLALERWEQEHGSIYRVDLGPGRSVVVVSDAEAIHAVMRERPEGFRRWRRQQEVFNEMLPFGNGVFLAEGDDWQRQRRLVMSALNSRNLQRYFDLVRISGLRLHQRLTEASGGRRTLDLVDELNSYTVDITSALVFGQDLNTLERRDNELQGHFAAMTAAGLRRMFAPVAYWRWVPFELPGDRGLRDSVKAIGVAVAEFTALGRERLAARPELRDQPENLLDAMLAAEEVEGAFTEAEIMGNVLSLLVAGQETTAHTLAWTVWLLATHPEVQRRVADEARAALGDAPFPVDHVTVDRLAYTEAVLRESIRLRSVAPAIAVEALVDTTVCGTHIPAGTELNLLLRAGAQDHGPDADEFRPERWIDDGPTPPKTLAFGSGPRFCPGRNLALIEVKSALAMITRDFEIALDPTAPPVQEHLHFAMAPAGLRVHLTPRAS